MNTHIFIYRQIVFCLIPDPQLARSTTHILTGYVNSSYPVLLSLLTTYLTRVSMYSVLVERSPWKSPEHWSVVIDKHVKTALRILDELPGRYSTQSSHILFTT